VIAPPQLAMVRHQFFSSSSGPTRPLVARQVILPFAVLPFGTSGGLHFFRGKNVLSEFAHARIVA
jgi:hypothetical protein